MEIEDLAEIPGIGDAASDIMQAVHSETQRRLGPAENDSQESVDAQEQEP